MESNRCTLWHRFYCDKLVNELLDLRGRPYFPLGRQCFLSPVLFRVKLHIRTALLSQAFGFGKCCVLFAKFVRKRGSKGWFQQILSASGFEFLACSVK